MTNTKTQEEITKMTYRELGDEVVRNRCELRQATTKIERKRELIARDHELMSEMDRRWGKR